MNTLPDDGNLRIDTEVQLYVLEMALGHFIKNHVDSYPYDECETEAEELEIRANRKGDVDEAIVLLNRVIALQDA